MRPVLSPASRRLWRDATTLQLGHGDGRAVVLAGLDEGDRRVLALLDGTRDLTEVEQAARRAGCLPERAREMVDLLAEAGLVADASERWPDRLDEADRRRLAPDVASLGLQHGSSGLSVLQRRDRAQVTVVGGGRVGAPLAALLSAAGVGTVDVLDEGPTRPTDLAVGGLEPDDLGRSRGSAARGKVRAVSTTTLCGPVARPDVVVLAAAGGADDVAALLRHGAPHLPAEVRDTVGVVGPLVLPGRSACLRCVDLTRTDGDPDWPRLAAQLSGPTRTAPPCDSTLAAAVSAQAALQVLTLLDGGSPAAEGGSLELALPDWRWRRRTWRPHPACGCQWRAAG